MTGNDVTRDDVQAMRWLLPRAHGDNGGDKDLAKLRKRMTPEQIHAAQAAAQAWESAHPQASGSAD